MQLLEIGKGECLKSGKDLAVITIGTMAINAAQAIKSLEKTHNTSIAHYDIRFMKPLDEQMLHEIGKKFKKIITIEEGVINGGFGSAVLEFMSDHDYKPNVKRLGINDIFVEHGTPEELHALIGIDAKTIADSIESLIQQN
jgi:1-deoxy-D-xylulose-5-phosphate synthase